MRKNTPVRDCMSHLPLESANHDPLSSVVQQMREHRCHHVPVMDGIHLVQVNISFLRCANIVNFVM